MVSCYVYISIFCVNSTRNSQFNCPLTLYKVRLVDGICFLSLYETHRLLCVTDLIPCSYTYTPPLEPFPPVLNLPFLTLLVPHRKHEVSRQ